MKTPEQCINEFLFALLQARLNVNFTLARLADNNSQLLFVFAADPARGEGFPNWVNLLSVQSRSTYMELHRRLWSILRNDLFPPTRTYELYPSEDDDYYASNISRLAETIMASGFTFYNPDTSQRTIDECLAALVVWQDVNAPQLVRRPYPTPFPTIRRS